jgi:hypothetical protein
MELAHFDEHAYKLEWLAYQTTLLDFKYGPLSFVSMEIGTNSRVLATPFVVQLIVITKPISPLRGITCLEIIPLHVQYVQVTIVTNEPMRGSEKSVKKQVELVDSSFNLLDNIIEPLVFLFANLLLIPH